ncbi:unnamed protein product [Heligmosomoides polygyrus]|uniref:NUC153 domain-containing protein n=1 Tax=Heligmosomoides polygyrus TaxID=6339 RepID=A0A183FUI0_HELPZ|nr:unnamed protein product [Heligmosomoides polygyrus]
MHPDSWFLVTIGKRFSAVLTDDRFSNKAKVDKRGRPLRKKGGNLHDLYELKDSDEEIKKCKVVDEEEEPVADVEKSRPDVDHAAEGSADEHDEEKTHVEDEEESDSDRPIKIDLARGEGNVSSSSDDDDSDSDWEANEDIKLEIDLAQDAEQVEWSSSRIAACNLDWNLVHCEDLMVIVFRPPGGSIKRIAIYLSDFGAERLAEEDKYGPRLQLSKPLDEYDGSEMDEETKLAMRKYQVDQLRYYYAVIECDSVKTAEAIYNECDGYQFESSNVKMDLRFIPDGMDFDKDRIKEELSEGDINVAKYKSKEKLKSAVTQTSARIGWDETEELRSRKFAEAFKWEEKDEEEESDDDHIVAKGRTKTVDAEGEENADTKEVEAKKKEVCFSYFKAANYEIQSMTIFRTILRAMKEKEDKEGAIVEAVAGDERFKALFTDSAFAIERSSKNYKGSKLIEKQVSAKRNAVQQCDKPDNASASDLVKKLKNKSAKWKPKG